MCLWKTLRSDGPISYDRSELEINQLKSLTIEGLSLSFHLPPFSLLDLVIYFANVWNEKEADINARERRDFEEDEVKSHKAFFCSALQFHVDDNYANTNLGIAATLLLPKYIIAVVVSVLAQESYIYNF